MNKTCSRCKLQKTSEDFGKKKSNLDGLQYWCRACRSSSDNHYKLKPEFADKQKAAKVKRVVKQLANLKQQQYMPLRNELEDKSPDYNAIHTMLRNLLEQTNELKARIVRMELILSSENK